ncbi:MAG: DHH family phosphoesterase [Candidatus Lokiarchaeota archaeon]|nr:DHH family phosphoesterase [Candidatus Lokiarchaeota archaeon]
MTQNPSEKRFLEALDNAVDLFSDHAKNVYSKVIAISHNDADGISSLQLIQNLLHKINIEYDYFIYNRSSSWTNYLNGILPKVQNNKTAFIFTDVGSTLSELIPIINKRKEHFFILDHHEVDVNINTQKLPDNLIFVNPTTYGYDGLEHIAGACLTYMFSKRIKASITKQGWLTIIGIAGDSLKSMDKLQSFNREIYQEILNEQLIEENEGLALFGGMHENIKDGLKHSILPYIKGCGGEPDIKIKSTLDELGINPTKKLIDLEKSEIESISNQLKIPIGTYALLPQKQGLLRFVFEHALLLNILSFKNISAALSIIQQKSITRYAKTIYNEYIAELVKNLRLLSQDLPRYETEKAVFIDAGNGKITPSSWSDTASFSTVNNLLPPNKMVFLGGLEKKTQMIKLSIRCSREYLQNNKMGVNEIINRIKEELGGTGGGHKLAGGLRLSKPSFNILREKVDHII